MCTFLFSRLVCYSCFRDTSESIQKEEREWGISVLVYKRQRKALIIYSLSVLHFSAANIWHFASQTRVTCTHRSAPGAGFVGYLTTLLSRVYRTRVYSCNQRLNLCMLTNSFDHQLNHRLRLLHKVSNTVALIISLQGVWKLISRSMICLSFQLYTFPLQLAMIYA